MTHKIIIPYDPILKNRARYLRNNSTRAEVILWRYLKNKQMGGYRFIRQKPLLHYIVDFYCAELKLILELDGYSHDNAKAQFTDNKRRVELEAYNLYILRFSNNDIYNNIEAVLDMIKDYIVKYKE